MNDGNPKSYIGTSRPAVCNMLLDKDMNARFGDFGLARMHLHEQLATTTHVTGTAGYYMAPEWLEHGKLMCLALDSWFWRWGWAKTYRRWKTKLASLVMYADREGNIIAFSLSDC
ncbi:hypothetical protein Dsin_033136 [Dipteronia sinensis]|uniref:Protein kinase domain-containing protein n=1 Tax=Dipteronia sinensis TaxID=43782 RepID=A0AAD9Z9F3_9ROSI|nr:hypothetical protein Dsin_033136 [Dipteronia sinensis]